MDLITHYPTLSAFLLVAIGVTAGWWSRAAFQHRQRMADMRNRVLHIVGTLVTEGMDLPSMLAIEIRYREAYGPVYMQAELDEAIAGLRKRGQIFRTTINHNTDKALAEVYGIPS